MIEAEARKVKCGERMKSSINSRARGTVMMANKKGIIIKWDSGYQEPYHFDTMSHVDWLVDKPSRRVSQGVDNNATTQVS